MTLLEQAAILELRIKLRGAMAVLEGQALAEFWNLMAEVERERPWNQQTSVIDK